MSLHRPDSAADSVLSSRVRAVLGPTNTGKTHLALERLLAHSSGVIGFPLRLLARENYDKMVARKGERSVALITGEEKIIPPSACWFSCTVEAMPMDRPVEFVAVDEIQLCADPDRGHVFTDRLLRARGLSETMFLGAETIRPLLKRLIPSIEIETRPRLSQLTYARAEKLARLPPRSAVVAFSAGELYAIAESIRRRRGGCAVVMGRLSPRTRNAQVALYQEGEVDFLVATDAIGMGLNMDVNHVAFAGLGKFDGHRPRRLSPAEVAQIAGRAGRGMRDGTFGTTAQCPPMDEELVSAVQTHRFDPLEHLVWRNADLDFSSLDRLMDSLNAPAPRGGLMRGPDASDVETLSALARDEGIRGLARSSSLVRTLWEACQIPDFRKLADETHVRLCGRVFGHLVQNGSIPTDWIGQQIAMLHRADGDIDTLMARLSGIRVWSYIAARTEWLKDAAHWQGCTREVEDVLSDALHQRLTARFVDRRAAHLMRRLEGMEDDLLSAITPRGEVLVEGHAVGQLGGFDFIPDPLSTGEERRLMLRAARHALRDEMPRRVLQLEGLPDSVLSWSPDHKILWDEIPIARLRAGGDPLAPRIEVLDSEYLDGPLRERIRKRVQAYLSARIQTDLAPLVHVMQIADAESALRGAGHRLREGLGVVVGATEAEISPSVRTRLKEIGVRAGRLALFVPLLLKPHAAVLRARLWALWQGYSTPDLPPPGQVVMSTWAVPEGFAAAMGWVVLGKVLMRLDMAERLAAELYYRVRKGGVALPLDVLQRFAVRAEQAPDVVRALGLRLHLGGTLGARHYGPPAPAMILPRRIRHQPAPAVAPPRPDSPFAALVALKGRT